jgi:hypothetical protein
MRTRVVEVSSWWNPYAVEVFVNRGKEGGKRWERHSSHSSRSEAIYAASILSAKDKPIEPKVVWCSDNGTDAK